MSISPVSISVNPRLSGQDDDGWQQFVQLVRTVNAGNLPAAQKTYDSFVNSAAADVVRGLPNGSVAQALGKIGDALQSGDIGMAQQALSEIRRTPPSEPAESSTSKRPLKAPSIFSSREKGPGATLDVTA